MRTVVCRQQVRYRLCQRRSIWGNEGIERREVIVFTPTTTVETWSAKSPLNIKHPSSHHTASLYGSFIHKNGYYNFNTVDDYVVDVAAAQSLPLAERGADSRDYTGSDSQQHDLIIWPDGLKLKNLVASDVPVLGQCLLKNKPLSIADLKMLLPGTAQVDKLLGINIMLSISTTYSYNHVLRAHGWFQDAFSRILPAQQVNYHICTQLKQPNNQPTQALIMPYDLHYTDVYNQKRVDRIVETIAVQQVAPNSVGESAVASAS